MNIFKGTSVSPGMEEGTVFKFFRTSLSFQTYRVEDTGEEEKRLKTHIDSALKDLSALEEKLTQTLGAEQAHIFRAQQTFLEDVEFSSDIIEKIREQKWCCEKALDLTYQEYRQLFSAMSDGYNKERVADLDDVYERLLREITGQEKSDPLSEIPPRSLLVAEELYPSDTASLDISKVAGIITVKGGVTSHTAILTKTFGIPGIVGCEKEISESVRTGDRGLIDTLESSGVLTISPSEKEEENFRAKKAQWEKKQSVILKSAHLEPVTKDGLQLEISGNAGSLEDIDHSKRQGAQCIGLFRTEFLFLDKKELPGEEEQFLFYKEALEKLQGEMLIVRTLDIGGDKQVPCLDLEEEENPFLGLRGVRLCLKKREIFLSQMKALMRAAVYGRLKVMYPMVTGPAEFSEVQGVLAEAEEILKRESKKYRSDFDQGVMIETPAAVFNANLFRAPCRFVSIGTNDLTQYLLASDRGNIQVADYYRMFDPAIFKAIRYLRDQLRDDIWMGVCGELGGLSVALPLLIGLGVTEFSMNPSAVPEAVHFIRELDSKECRDVAARVLSLGNQEEVKNYLEQYKRSVLKNF